MVGSGFLNICKEPGFTSHDVVAVVRRLLALRRVGHAGTLDPAAEGVLPICVGRATRLVDRLADCDKGYYAEVVLGVQTRTDDAEGEMLDTAAVPNLTPAALDAALDTFRGPILQRPPAFSAIKVGGRRAYHLARQGQAPHLQAREVTVHRLTLHWWRPPRLALTVACSKGTYIRSIARDLGEALGCGAHLARLVRLWVGSFRLADAHSLDELAAAIRDDALDRHLLPPDVAIGDLSVAIVEPARAADMQHGRAWAMEAGLQRPQSRDPVGAVREPPLRPPDLSTGHDGPTTDPGLIRVYDTTGSLLGLAAADRARGVWQPKLALPRTEA